MNPEQTQKASQYIRDKVSSLLEQMTNDLLEEKPESVSKFMLDWLERFPHGQAVPQKEKEVVRRSSISSCSEEEDPEEVQRLLMAKMAKAGNSRKSVSAEVYGQFNRKADFKPRVVPKDEETYTRIKELLSKSFLFRGLEADDMHIIVKAMEVRKFAENEKVIVQGEDGNELYIVSSGQLNCFKRFPNKTEDTFLKTYEPGEYFGELALLYNAPRAASITAKVDSLCYSLDRECFNLIVKEAMIKNREKYDTFLSNIQILHNLDAYERNKLGDILTIDTYEPGQTIIKEGDIGTHFFMVMEGSGKAIKKNPKTGEDVEVMSYQPNSYFGELALMNNLPRAATIVASVS